MSFIQSRTSVESIPFLEKTEQQNEPKNEIVANNTIRLRKLKTLLSIDDKKILEIKGKKKRVSNFHLVNEDDKYNHIQKNLQNTILNISIKMMDNYKFDPEVYEMKQKQSKKRLKTKGTLSTFIKKGNEGNKHIVRQSIKNQDILQI